MIEQQQFVFMTKFKTDRQMEDFGFYTSSIVFKSYRDHKSLLLFMFSSENKCKMQIQHFCFVN